MRKIGVFIVAFSMCAPFAFGQTQDMSSSSGSSSSAMSSSGNENGASSSNSSSDAGGGNAAGGNGSASVSQIYNTIADPGPSTTTSNTNVHYSGTQTINDVPAQASLIETPTAPCMVPVGGTISVAGFGGGAEGAYTSQTCETLERVRMTWNMNQQDVADQMMCQFADYRNARATVGKPCPETTNIQTASVSVPSTTEMETTQAISTNESQPETKQVTIIAATQHTTAPPPSELSLFCQSLNPDNPDDVPYIQSECNKE